MPKPFELFDIPFGGLLPIPLLQVGGAQFDIRDLPTQEMIRHHQQGMGDGDHRLFMTAMPHDPAITCGQHTVLFF